LQTGHKSAFLLPCKKFDYIQANELVPNFLLGAVLADEWLSNFCGLTLQWKNRYHTKYLSIYYKKLADYRVEM